MRNKSKLKIILIALGIVFAFSSINNYNIIDDQNDNNTNIEIREVTNLKNPKISGFWPNCPRIHIQNDNWSETDLEWIQNQTGTYNDPHRIENVTINGGGTGSGIFIENSSDYFIIRNCTIYNAQYGIRLEYTENGTLTSNDCSNNARGIMLVFYCKNNTISDNIASGNSAVGIWLELECDNNTIKNNTVNNQTRGIRLINGCDNNTLLGNTAKENSGDGIYLNNNCNNNTIAGNIADDNNGHGIFLSTNCDNTSILGNTANDNFEYGILITDNCHNIIISGNTAKFNKINGILIDYCNYCNISGNILQFNMVGLTLAHSSGNFVYANDFIGNTIVHAYIHPTATTQWDDGYAGNFWDNYTGFDLYPFDGIGETPYIESYGGINDTKPLLYPILDDSDGDGLENREEYTYGSDGYHTCVVNPDSDDDGLSDYWEWKNSTNPLNPNTDGDPFNDGDEAEYNTNPLDPLWYPMPNLKVSHFSSVVAYEGTSFILDFSMRNNGIWKAEGVIVIVRCEELDLTLFNNTNSPFNLDVDDTEYIAINYPPIGQTGTLSLNLTIDPNNIINETYSSKDGSARIDAEDDNSQIADLTILPEIKTLNLAIISQSFSNEDFNISFFIYDDTGQYIDFAIIQVWWNGADISNIIQNLGNGLYLISLDPITVAPGEDPILLKMAISASGYEELQFETYLAVDPATLEKEAGKGTEEIPTIIVLIAIISTIAGIGVATISVVLLRRRKRTSQAI